MGSTELSPSRQDTMKRHIRVTARIGLLLEKLARQLREHRRFPFEQGMLYITREVTYQGHAISFISPLESDVNGIIPPRCQHAEEE